MGGMAIERTGSPCRGRSWVAILTRLGSPLASDSANFRACLGEGACRRASAARTGQPPLRDQVPASSKLEIAISSAGTNLLGPFATEPHATASLGEFDEVDRLELDPVFGVPKKDHLLPLDLPSTLFLMTMTLIGSLCLTAVMNSTMSIVNPPSPTKATTWRSGKATWAAGVRQAGRHRREISRTRKLLMAARADLQVPGRPSGDRPGVGRDDRVVGHGRSFDMLGDDLGFERGFRYGSPESPLCNSHHSFMLASGRFPETSGPFFTLEQLEQCLKCRLGVASQADVDGESQAEPLGVAVDLHEALSLVGFREDSPCRGSWCRPSAGCRSSSIAFSGRKRTEQASIPPVV